MPLKKVLFRTNCWRGVIDYDLDEEWNWEVELRRNPAWREQLVAEHEFGQELSVLFKS